MAEQIDYRVTLDTSQLDTGLQEIRTRVSGAMGTGPSDFAGMAGGLSQFASAATAGWATMRGGLERAGATISTATEPRMAHAAHYGVPTFQSSFWQEWSTAGDPVAASFQTPPGVGAPEYAEALQRNWDKRMSDIATGALGGAVPVATGFAAWGAAAKVGKWARLGGLAAGALGMGVGVAAEMVVGKGIERGNQIFQETQELGQLATAGRGMSLAETHEFGRGFRGMAKDMGISTNELGDMVAGIRQAGMMPRTRDVKESLSQFEGMAKDIREIAVGMQTSLANATRHLRDVERLGMGRGAGGVFAAAGMAEQLGTSLGGLVSYVDQGRQMGMATGVGGGAGSQLALRSAFAGAAGMGALTGQERLMVGGATGLGRAFQANAMQNALGPWGAVQGMAMMGPTGAMALPGTMMGTIEQAGQNIFGGGDPIANMVEFTTNRRRMMSQMGGRGIQMMQAQAIETEAQMLMQLSPGMSADRARQFVAQNKGLNEHQARAMSSYISRGFRGPRGPGAAARGLPGLFGGVRTADAAIRAASDIEARQVAVRAKEEGKMPWTRAIDWLGTKWAEGKMEYAETLESERKQRMARMGYIDPSEEALTTVTKIMRTGKGEDIDAPIYLGGTGTAGNQMQTVLALAGSEDPSKGPLTIGGIRDDLAGMAKNVHIASREKGAVENAANEAMMVIGNRIVDNEFNAKKAAENLAANVTQITEGGGNAAELRRSVSGILKGTGLEDEFMKTGFAGTRGATMLSTVNRFMRGQGREGFDLGRNIRQWSARGMAAVAYGFEKADVSGVRKIMGLGDITEVAKEHAEARAYYERTFETHQGALSMDVALETVRAQKDADARPEEGIYGTVSRWFREFGSGHYRSNVRAAQGDVTQADIEKNMGFAINEIQNQERFKKTVDLMQTKEVQDYLKTRDTLYYAPYRRARNVVRRMKKYKKKPAMTGSEARAFFTGEKLKGHGPVLTGAAERQIEMSKEVRRVGDDYKKKAIAKAQSQKLDKKTIRDIDRRIIKSVGEKAWYKDKTAKEKEAFMKTARKSYLGRYGGKLQAKKIRQERDVRRVAAEKGIKGVADNLIKNTKQSKETVETAMALSKRTRIKKKKAATGKRVAFQNQADSFQSQITTALRKTTRVLDTLVKKAGNVGSVKGENNAVDKPKSEG